MKLEKYYCIGTLLICSANFADTVRSLLLMGSKVHVKLDLFGALTETAVALWLIVAVLVLVESIRREKVIAPALFYVVTMSTFLLTSPLIPIYGWGHTVEGIIMLANAIVHLVALFRKKKSDAPKKDINQTVTNS